MFNNCKSVKESDFQRLAELATQYGVDPYYARSPGRPRKASAVCRDVLKMQKIAGVAQRQTASPARTASPPRRPSSPPRRRASPAASTLEGAMEKVQADFDRIPARTIQLPQWRAAVKQAKKATDAAIGRQFRVGRDRAPSLLKRNEAIYADLKKSYTAWSKIYDALALEEPVREPTNTEKIEQGLLVPVGEKRLVDMFTSHGHVAEVTYEQDYAVPGSNTVVHTQRTYDAYDVYG